MKRNYYTIPEYFEIQRQEEISKLEKAICHIKKNKKIYQALIVSLAIVFSKLDISYANDMGKLDSAGFQVLGIIRQVGYWIILFKGLMEILKKSMQRDFQGVGEVVIQYVIIFASLWFFPWALELGRGLF